MKTDLIAVTNNTTLDYEMLRGDFLECIAVCRGVGVNRIRLREAVKGLIDRGVDRDTLVSWAVQAGYARGSASSLLSRIFCTLGLRTRKKGAGRRHSDVVLQIAFEARRRHGKNFRKLLRAASMVSEGDLPVEDVQSSGRLPVLLLSSISPAGCVKMGLKSFAAVAVVLLALLNASTTVCRAQSVVVTGAGNQSESLVLQTSVPTLGTFLSVSGNWPPSPFLPPFLSQCPIYSYGPASTNAHLNQYLIDDRDFDYSNYFSAQASATAAACARWMTAAVRRRRAD